MTALDLQTELGVILLKQGKKKEAKRNLKLSHELYQSVKALDEVEKERYAKYCEDRKMAPFSLHMQLQHVNLLRNYEQYYKLIEDIEKQVHNGLLVLKYEQTYNLFEALSWLAHCVDLTTLCCELHAYRQSHYLLRAADEVLRALKATTHVPSSMESIFKAKQIHLMSARIRFGYAQHCLFLLYQTKNVSFLVEKVKKGLGLTQEEAHDLQKDTKVIEFEELTVPKGDFRLDGLLSDFDEIREIYKKVRDWMAEVNTAFTIAEKEQYEYDLVAEKLRDLLEAYPFLDSIR